jgi:hypothetical protein
MDFEPDWRLEMSGQQQAPASFISVENILVSYWTKRCVGLKASELVTYRKMVVRHESKFRGPIRGQSLYYLS